MKKIGILFGLFAALLAFVYVYEFRGAEEREKERELEQSLLRLNPEEVTSFDIEQPDNPLLRIVHEEEGWRLQQPIEGEVDPFEVDAFLRDLSAARRERTLEDVSGQLAQYGLLHPRLRITVRTGSERETILKVGSDDFSGDRLYTQLEGESEVIISSTNLFSAGSKNLRDWRSKSVLDFDQEAISEIDLEQAGRRLRLEKRDSDWKLVEPLQDRASESEVSSLLSTIKYARIEDFVDDPVKPGEAGLDAPRYRFRVRSGQDQEWQVLEVGSQAPGKDSFFARTLSRPLLFTVRQTVVDKLSQEPARYRDLRVVDLSQDGFTELKYRHGEVSFKLARQGGSFVLVEPEGMKGREAPAYRFWYPLQDLKFESLADAPSAENDPRFREPVLVLEFRVGVEIRLFEFAEAEGQIWARQANTGRAGQLPREAFEKILFTPDSISNPPVDSGQ